MGRTVLPIVLAVVAGLGVVVSVTVGDPASVLPPAAYGGAGAYVAFRRPSNPIGWLLILTGWGVCLGVVVVEASPATLLAGSVEPRLAVAAWAGAWGYSLAFLGLVSLAFVFPDGHLPAGRAMRWSGLFAIASMVGLSAIIAIYPTITPTFRDSSLEIAVPNPLAVAPAAGIWTWIPAPETLYPLMGLPVAVTGAGLIARARRATGAARLQYRWFMAAVLLVVVATFGWAIAVYGFAAEGPRGLTFLPAQLALTSIPIAIAVAVLRYRLFEIDRIVSRTIGWATVTGTLVLIFAGLVVGLQALLTDVTQGQTLAVAASTLIAFALFQPVRRRVQAAVDRRFDRGRYDGERTATTFAERLRDEVDLDRIVDSLESTVDGAVRPSRTTIWMPTREGR